MMAELNGIYLSVHERLDAGDVAGLAFDASVCVEYISRSRTSAKRFPG